ncbi:MAG: hypothetical protein J5959_02850 [Butyrivibrio sp.]|nr:hypothetical protein [Butyrivibrio sp.]
MENIDNPVCTFKDHEYCFARSEGRCTILTTVPKKRKDGSCPFYKPKETKRGKWDD